jgi:regulator of replication initiation timing
MTTLTSELSGFAKECEKLNEQFVDRPCPTLVIETPPVEAPANNELAELQQQMEFQVERSQLLEEQNVDLASRLSGVDAENDALRQENADLRQRIDHLQEALTASNKSVPADAQHGNLLEAVDLVVENQDAASVLRLLETAYPDRLRVFDSVYDQLHRFPSLPVGQLYQRTKALATAGVDVIRESGRVIDLRDVVPGDISVQESETVKKSAKLRSLRSFRDGRASREVFTHLNIDYSHRLYFEFDVEEDRMLIAYAGKHLPSAKNATV